MIEVLFAFLFSGAMTVLFTPIFKKLALKVDMVDHPGDRKKHYAATPLLGGLGIFLSFSLVILLGVLIWPELSEGAIADTPLEWISLVQMVLGGGLIMIFVGMLDDKIELNPVMKLLLHSFAAFLVGLFFIWRGAQLSLFMEGLPLLSAIITILWLVGITNSMNLLDHSDGLAAGIGVIASFFFAIINLMNGNYAVGYICAALGGACAGFLLFNFHPATVFMGDTGSNFIGFTLGIIAVLGVYTPEGSIRQLAVLSPILILAVPILDTILVSIYRLRRGAPLFAADRNHLAHRLIRIGVSPREAIILLYILSGLFGILALLLPTLKPSQAVLVFLIALGVSFIFAFFIRNGERIR